MKRLGTVMMKAVALIALMGLTVAATGNPDPERTGPANNGGTSGPASGNGSNGSSSSSSSGSGCSK